MSLNSRGNEPRHLELTESSNSFLPSRSTVEDSSERAEVLRILASLYNTQKLQTFPGSHPISITVHDLKRVHSDRCFASLKADGVRFLMLLCVINGDFRALMLDRRMRIFEVSVMGNEEFFTKYTLLDGELVMCHRTATLSFQVFDVVCVAGRRMHRRPYCDRLQEIHNLLLSELPPSMQEMGEGSLCAENFIIEENKLYASQCDGGASRPMRLMPKRFVNFADGRDLWLDRDRVPWPCDGLIINFDHAPIHCGTARSILKWKPHNVVDVVVSVADMSVLCRSAGKTIPLKSLLFHGEKLSVALVDNNLLQWLLHRKAQHRAWLLECSMSVVNSESGRTVQLWAMRERVDKEEANDVRVIQATLDDFENQVTFEKLWSSDSQCIDRDRGEKRTGCPPPAGNDDGDVNNGNGSNGGDQGDSGDEHCSRRRRRVRVARRPPSARDASRQSQCTTANDGGVLHSPRRTATNHAEQRSVANVVVSTTSVAGVYRPAASAPRRSSRIRARTEDE